jgi:hypothetical protein
MTLLATWVAVRMIMALTIKSAFKLFKVSIVVFQAAILRKDKS